MNIAQVADTCGKLQARALLGVLCCVSVLTWGCSHVPSVPPDPLKPVQMTAGSCALDMFFVRVPVGDPTANVDVWQAVDESRIPAELRLRLAEAGFRVGVVGQHLPTELAELFQITSDPENGANPSLEVTVTPDQLSQPAKVVRRHLQIPPGQRQEICTGGIREKMYLLFKEEDIGPVGRFYENAQPVLALTYQPELNGTVKVHLQPEVQYGQLRSRYVGNQGMFRLEVSRPKEVFSRLAVTVELQLGESLLVSCWPDKPGSIGYKFFTHVVDGRTEQKLLLIRLSQVQHDGLFDPAIPVALSDQLQSSPQ